MAKETTIDVSKLPTLDDFQESSLLSKSKAQTAAATGDASITTDKTDADADKADKADKLKSETEKKKQEAGKKTEPAKKTEAVPEISEEDLNILKAKADKDIDSLTDEEKKILIAKDYLEEKPTSTFWDDVSKIHGIELDVDYGDLDPESVEAAALRDQTLVNKTVTDYLEYLKTNYPNSYKFMEHEARGGKIEDLFPSIKNDYSKVDLKEDNKEQQVQILKDYYKTKGFDEKRINRLIEADEDSEEGLFNAAKSALQEQIAKQKKEEVALIEQTKKTAEAAQLRDDNFKAALKSITDKGSIGEFTINSKNDREEFYNFLLGNTYFNDKTQSYQVVLPLNQETLVPVMQQMLFSFKEGNLEDYVKREAGTKLVRKLQKKAAQDANKVSSQENNTQSGVKKLPTLDAFTVGG